MIDPRETLEMLKEDRKNFADGTQEAFMLDVMIAKLGQAIINEGIGLTTTTLHSGMLITSEPAIVRLNK